MLCDLKKTEPREKLMSSDDQADKEENEKSENSEYRKKDRKLFLIHHPEANEQLYPLNNKLNKERADI